MGRIRHEKKENKIEVMEVVLQAQPLIQRKKKSRIWHENRGFTNGSGHAN